MKKKGILFPAEHGSWGLIAEPLLLGMLVAPSPSGSGVAVFTFATFLLRTPALRLLRARRAPSPDPHGPVVKRFALICALAGLTGFLLALFTARGPWLVPLLAALPLALWTIREQDRGKTRTLWPELIAAIAIGAPASAIALAAGQPLLFSLALWFWLGLKSLTSILYVRTQIKRFHHRPDSREGVVLLHAAIPSLLLILNAPPHVFILFLLLSVRATVFLFRPVTSPKIIGWTEVAFSLLFVLGLAFGG
ncbi:MAG: YwiC-like family protein [Verrucomicrobia bacterium]|nr:YwiC-like family protein [Verrucomicrobiota bacterium]MCH8513392.1 YwiC-like family protein [Kiritimatiellia bacterium]